MSLWRWGFESLRWHFLWLYSAKAHDHSTSCLFLFLWCWVRTLVFFVIQESSDRGCWMNSPLSYSNIRKLEDMMASKSFCKGSKFSYIGLDEVELPVSERSEYPRFFRPSRRKNRVQAVDRSKLWGHLHSFKVWWNDWDLKRTSPTTDQRRSYPIPSKTSDHGTGKSVQKRTSVDASILLCTRFFELGVWFVVLTKNRVQREDFWHLYRCLYLNGGLHHTWNYGIRIRRCHDLDEF